MPCQKKWITPAAAEMYANRCNNCQRLAPNRRMAALKLVEAGLSPTVAAKQLGLGRSTVYRELSLAGIQRPPHPA